MDTVIRATHWTRRRVIALLASLLMATLLAGGAGGYLIKGATTLTRQATTVTTPLHGSHAATTGYFGHGRTSGGYIAGI